MGYSDQIFLPYKNIAAAATTVIAGGPGRLSRIVVNGGTLTGTITVYDNTAASGTKIATIGANQVVGYNFVYNCQFRVGLTVVTSANVDITVIADNGS
jgi:hypothetical protein